MSTFEVGLKTRFINSFTRTGRMKNRYYAAMKERGQKYIVQRDLKDGSSVILSYLSKNFKYADFALKMNKDGSGLYKQENVYNIALANKEKEVRGKGTSIEKFWIDKNGRATGTSEIFVSDRQDGHVYKKDKLNWRNGKFVREEHYREISEEYNGKEIPLANNVKRIIIKPNYIIA